MDTTSYKAREFLEGLQAEFPNTTIYIRKDEPSRIIISRFSDTYYMHIFTLNKNNVWEETVRKYTPYE
jgi:hypothetical protein